MESQAGAVATELNFFYHFIGCLLINEIQSYLVYLSYFKVIRFDMMSSFWLSW